MKPSQVKSCLKRNLFLEQNYIVYHAVYLLVKTVAVIASKYTHPVGDRKGFYTTGRELPNKQRLYKTAAVRNQTPL